MDHHNNNSNLVVDTATMDPIIASYFRTHFSPSPSSRPTNVPTTLGHSEVDSQSQPERQRRRRTSHTSSPHTANDRGRPSLRRGSHRKPAPAAIATPTFSFFSKCSSKKSPAETPSSAATSPSASSTSSTFNKSSALSTSPSSPHQQPQFLGPRAWQSQYAGVYAAMQFAPRSAFSASTESDAEDDDEEQPLQTQPHDLKDDEEQLSSFPFPSPPSSVSTPAMPSTPTRSEEGGYMELLEGDFVEKARLALERREVTFGRRSVDK